MLTRRAAPAALTRAEPAPQRAKKEKPKAYDRRRRAWQVREKRRVAALSRWTAAEDARLAAGTSIGFSGFQDATYDGEIAVATNTPYVLGSVSAPVRLATYGDTPGAMSALVDVLLGRATAPGRLPVDGGRRRAGRAARPAPRAVPCRRRPPGSAPASPSSSPQSDSRLRSCSGTTSTPRFLIVSRPMLRSRRAALSCFSR